MPDMLDNLDFGENWNHKLDCDCYTTFRINSAKYTPGKKLNVRLKKQDHHIAQIINVKPMYLAEACNSQLLTYLDTGYSPTEFRKIVENMYKNMVKDVNSTLFVLVLLKKIKPQAPK